MPQVIRMVAAAHGVAAAIITITTIMAVLGDKGQRPHVAAARTHHLISKIFCAKDKIV